MHVKAHPRTRTPASGLALALVIALAACSGSSGSSSSGSPGGSGTDGSGAAGGGTGGTGTGGSGAGGPTGGGASGGTSGGGSSGGGATGGGSSGGGGTGSGGSGGTGSGGSSGSGGVTFGGPGPWPVANAIYGSADGIQEGPVVGTSTDESQNLWVATPQALYLLTPGAKAFKRFTAADGLHLPSHPQHYEPDFCGSWSGAGDGWGNAIQTITGGGPNEVFVGYLGTLAVNGDCTDPVDDRHSGKLDRVRLNADGTLEVKRLDMVATGMGMSFWHNRSVYRMVYDHLLHPHTLYVGTDHGVDMMYPDKYRDPNPGEWTGTSIQEWMADHVHVQVCFHGDTTCLAGGEGNARMGDWRGLAIDKDGDLWHAGRWSAGKIIWVQDLHTWSFRGGAAFSESFGTGTTPVFPVAQVGDVVSMSAVAVDASGSAWFSKAFFYAASASGPSLARYLGNQRWEYHDASEAGLPSGDVQDMVALSDGRLVLASSSSGIVFWNPSTGAHQSVRAGSGLPDDRVIALELDTMVNPPALHVSTAGGVAVLRVFP